MMRHLDFILDVATAIILAAVVLIFLGAQVVRANDQLKATGTRFGPALWRYMLVGAVISLIVIWRLFFS